MSRVGIKPIEIPAGVKVSLSGQTVTVEGPKGTLTREFSPLIEIAWTEDEKSIVCSIKGEATRQAKALFDRARPVTITIDAQLCQGHSVCVSEAPKVFHVNDEGEAELLPEATGLPEPVQQATFEVADPSAREALYQKLERAYRHCPNRTFSFTQEEPS